MPGAVASVEAAVWEIWNQFEDLRMIQDAL